VPIRPRTRESLLRQDLDAHQTSTPLRLIAKEKWLDNSLETQLDGAIFTINSHD
jgi:hypothetical protein